jgi:hypothetical protein
MGWTHYWKRDVELPAEAFAKAAKDCKVVLSQINVPLAGPMSEGEPIFNSDAIMFNGIKGQNCEPFLIRLLEHPRRLSQTVFSYCKTEKLPYDLCVKSALVVLKHYLGEHIRIMSDGKDQDWSDAKQLCLSNVGYGTEFILSTNE